MVFVLPAFSLRVREARQTHELGKKESLPAPGDRCERVPRPPPTEWSCHSNSEGVSGVTLASAGGDYLRSIWK